MKSYCFPTESLHDTLTTTLYYDELPLYLNIQQGQTFPGVRKCVQALNWITWLGTRPQTKVFIGSRPLLFVVAPLGTPNSKQAQAWADAE